MAEEKPVVLKRERKRTPSGDKTCIIHNHNVKSPGNFTLLNQASWDRIQNTANIRRQAPNDADKLTALCASIPTQYIQNIHGYHRVCYQLFTNVKSLRKRSSAVPATSDSASCSDAKRRKADTSGSRLFPTNQCIICQRDSKYVKRKKDRLIKCVTESAKISILEAAQRKEDSRLTGLLQNFCLIAKEGHYHDSCRREYTRKYDTPPVKELPENLIAHEKATQWMKNYIEETIIQQSQVERVTMLRERYLSYLQSNHPDAYNPDYKTYKLKAKIQTEFGDRVKFWQPGYRGELIYSAELPKGFAIETAFEMASSDKKRLEEAAILLRRHIIDASKKSELPWPPTAEDLQPDTLKPPDILLNFLSHLLSKNARVHRTVKQERLARSIADDICSCVTNGHWKMPKHILLGVSVRHLTGSAQLIHMLNRFGHTISYSAILEIETAICDSITDCNHILPEQIRTDNNIVTHFCWDNFDLAEETLSGADTTHTTHGIVIQEVSGTPDEEVTYDREPVGCQTDVRETTTVIQKKRRSTTYQPKELPPCFLKQKTEPTMPTVEVCVPPLVLGEIPMQGFLWIFCRSSLEGLRGKVPGWHGWVSATTAKHENKSTIGYMPPINAPSTQPATVQEIINISQQATRELGQEYTIITCDLAIARIAYALVWQNQQAYSDVIVRLGAFHTMCSYFGALGKLMQGTGFEEIVIESGICASGSINKVMSGKHYNRALRVHVLMMEALERCLFKQFEQYTNSNLLLKSVQKDLSESMLFIDENGLENSLENENCRDLWMRYSHFREEVHQGRLGKTAQFWIKYMDKVWLLLRFLKATKTNNFIAHVQCLQEMCPLFFAMDHQSYARYISAYILSLINLPHSHPGADELLKNKGFSVAKSLIPASRTAVDLSIEQTINRQAKSKGGIIGFSRNKPAYHRWCVTRHTRAAYLNATLELADMDKEDSSTHKEERPSKIKESETAVQHVYSALNRFIDPFDIDEKESLVCLSSGMKASDDISEDLLSVDYKGQQQCNEFLQKCLVEKEHSFHKPIKKTSLKTFQKCQKTVSVKTSKQQRVQIVAQRNIFGQLLMLSMDHELDLQKVLTYPLSPVPWALATPDGLPAKTDKSSLMHALENPAVFSDATNNANTSKEIVIDGNALLHSLINIPETFGQLTEKIFQLLPPAERIHFVTDSYKPKSIKCHERKRRGSNQTQSLLLRGQSTKTPRDWKSFLSNDDNKRNFITLLKESWEDDKFAARLKKKEIMFVCEEQCISLTSKDGVTTESSIIHSLCSSHEEADNRIILHCFHAAKSNCEEVVVHSPDTDVFLLMLYFAAEIPKPLFLLTGTGCHRRLINMSALAEMHDKSMIHAILGFHAFTGCDTTSAFIRRGKTKPLKIMKARPQFRLAFEALGVNEIVDVNILSELEQFVCHMYGKNAYSDVNKLRFDLARQRFRTGSGNVLSNTDGIDFSLLPPCRSALQMHIKRANYQTLLWKKSDVSFPDLPPPEDHGWVVIKDGDLDCNWCDGDIVPQDLVDVMSTHQPENREDDVCDTLSDEFDSENSESETSDSEGEHD